MGYSRGGSSAPYIGSNESMFRAFGVLHGGVVQGGIGSNIMRGWFSTGADDSARPPSLEQQSVDYMKGIGFNDLAFKTYPGGHELGETEVGDVIGWWLGGLSRQGNFSARVAGYVVRYRVGVGQLGWG